MPVMNINGVEVSLSVDDLIEYQARVKEAQAQSSAQARLERNPHAVEAIRQGDKDLAEGNVVVVNHPGEVILNQPAEIADAIREHVKKPKPAAKSAKSTTKTVTEASSKTKTKPFIRVSEAGYLYASHALTAARMVAQFNIHYSDTIFAPASEQEAEVWLLTHADQMRSLFNYTSAYIDRVAHVGNERHWNATATLAAMYIYVARHGRASLARKAAILEDRKSELRRLIDKENRDYFAKCEYRGRRRFGSIEDRLALVWLIVEHLESEGV